MFTDHIHMRMLHSGLNDSHSLRRLDSTKTESLFYKSVDRCSETADLTGKDEILRVQLCLSQILLGREISI